MLETRIRMYCKHFVDVPTGSKANPLRFSFNKYLKRKQEVHTFWGLKGPPPPQIIESPQKAQSE